METGQRVVDRVQAIALPIVRALGLELVEVSCSGQGPRTLFRVFIDKPGGVKISDCEQVHKSLGYALDIEDPIPHAYTLEVSSPGLDRPFRSREEYTKSIGKSVEVRLRRPYEGQWVLSGELLSVDEPGILLGIREKRSKRAMRVSWEDVSRARREVEF